jgi:hypothetical protein
MAQGSRPEDQSGLIRFVSHLVFALPYVFLDFSGGIYQVGTWIWAAVAVGVHGAYDAFAIGLADGRDVEKLTRGSVSERIEVLLGRPVSVSEVLKAKFSQCLQTCSVVSQTKKKAPSIRSG